MEFNELVRTAKARLLSMHYESKVGHIGGNLSALDAMLYLHLRAMTPHDVFVLSKGHSAGALYVTLWMRGQISDSDLKTFHQEGTKLAGHPVAGWNGGIPFSTGSLGHGLSLAAGVALAKRLKNEQGTVYCLMSDGEWEEGSNWEALIFLVHQRLANLVVLVDANGLQGFGKTDEVASLEPLAEKIRAFGLDVQEINGHDEKELDRALASRSDGPKAIILRTIKGHGISFMENQMQWHYLCMNEEQYLQAMSEVKAR